MSARRTAARRDKNEREIVDALTGVGASVQRLSDKGVPDLLVSHHGTLYLMEVKRPKQGRLTPEQIEWITNWDSEVYVVTSDEEALRVIGVIS